MNLNRGSKLHTALLDFFKFSLSLAIVVICTGVVFAGGDGAGFPDDVPEINPGVLGGALSLLVGGTFLIRDRLRSRSE